MDVLAIIAVCAAIIGLIVAVALAMWIKNQPEGTDKMKTISEYDIRCDGYNHQIN